MMPHDYNEITLVLHGRRPLIFAAPRAQTINRELFIQNYGASEESFATVARFVERFGLQIVAWDSARRTMLVGGSEPKMIRAFGIELGNPGNSDYQEIGSSVAVPDELVRVVQGIFGFDNKQRASPCCIAGPTRDLEAGKKSGGIPAGFTPLELGEIYDLPALTDGSGQTIALLEFGGDCTEEHLRRCFEELNLPCPKITTVFLSNSDNQFEARIEQHETRDHQVVIDLAIIGSLAPAANVVIYRAPPTERGWVDAVRMAVHHPIHLPSVISISWGWPERGDNCWSVQALEIINETFREAAALGVTVLSASCDALGNGQTHSLVTFPASSPFVTSVGGTSLKRWKALGIEMAWKNGRSSGEEMGSIAVSKIFPRPSYQAELPFTHGRALPDVSANADPKTGLRLRLGGKEWVMGGTGLATSLWAALILRLNQALGKPLGFLNPILYRRLARGNGLRDIVIGRSRNPIEHLGSSSSLHGWDTATGWGVPVGSQLRRVLVEPQANPRVQYIPISVRRPPQEENVEEDIPAYREETSYWIQQPGTARGIAMGEDGSIWAIGGLPDFGGYRIHQWRGNYWGEGELAAIRLAIGPKGEVATINAVGMVGVRDITGRWTSLPGFAADIAYGPDGTLWSVGNFTDRGGFTRLHRWDGSQWLMQDVFGVRVAVTAENNPAIITASGVALLYKEGQWKPVHGFYTDIECGRKGMLYALGIDRCIYAFPLVSEEPQAPEVLTQGTLAMTAGASGVWMVKQNGSIWFLPGAERSSSQPFLSP
jgi:kumamolisin